MRTLYLDCGMGAAGDMLAAALLELLPDPDAFVAELNRLNQRHGKILHSIVNAHFRSVAPGKSINLDIRIRIVKHQFAGLHLRFHTFILPFIQTFRRISHNISVDRNLQFITSIAA